MRLPQRGHGDDGVPEGGRDGREVRAVHVFLGVKHDGGEYDDGHGQGEHQEPEFGGARLERVAEYAEPLRVPGELEYPEHPEHAERDEGAGHVVVVGDAQADVIGQDGYHVDDAHDAAHKLAPVRGGEQPQQILGGEYHHASRVQAEEHDLVAFTARQCAHATRPVAARHRLHHVGHDGHGDEETGDVVEDERRGGRVWVAECPPHLLPDVGELWQVLVAVLRQLVVHQPLGVLTLPVPVVLVAAVADDVWQYAEERQLLVVAGQALVLRVVQLAGAVVVEYVPEYVRVAVEEVLLAVFVVEELPFVRPEQRVRVLFHRVPPCLEPAPRDVNQ